MEGRRRQAEEPAANNDFQRSKSCNTNLSLSKDEAIKRLLSWKKVTKVRKSSQKY